MLERSREIRFKSNLKPRLSLRSEIRYKLSDTKYKVREEIDPANHATV